MYKKNKHLNSDSNCFRISIGTIIIPLSHKLILFSFSFPSTAIIRDLIHILRRPTDRPTTTSIRSIECIRHI